MKKPLLRLLFPVLALSLTVSSLWGSSLWGQVATVQPERVKASNSVALRELVGQEVTLYGTIASTGKSSGGHQFLNFYGNQVAVFCSKDDVAKFREGEPANLYKGKEVEVTGALSQFQGKLQLKLTDPANIRVVTTSSQPDTKPATVKLQPIGKEAWLSPAGLRYQGRDPDGLTRVEHILRHTRDIPERDGPHGVFDGGQDVAFAVIDEAWQIATEKKLRADVEGDRSSYSVRMGRRVGYLGGQTGKLRGQPPLDRVFIVFETGTKNIVTAFPR